MKNIKSIFLIFISLAVFSSCSENVNKKEDSKMKPPVAKKIPKELSIHGDTRIDPYYWLRERENPEVIAYLEAENKYTEYCIKDYDSLKDQLYHEMIGRIKQEDVSAPYFNNGYFYYTRYEKNKEYEIECRKKDSLENTEEVIFDVNNMAVGYEYYALGDFSVSPDNKLAAFSFDTVSRRQYIIKVKNLENGEILSDIIDNTEGDIVWANDNNTFFYVEKDPVTLRGFRVKKHKLGTLSSEDQTVFEENDETFDVYIKKTKDNAFLLIGSNSTMADEYRYVDADQPDDTFKVIQPRERGIEYSVYHHSDYFYIRTNYEAQNFRLMKVPTAGKLSKENWIEVIPHRDSVLLEGIEVFENFLVTEEKTNGLPRINIIKLQDNSNHYISFEEEAYVIWTSYNPEFNSNILRYSYSSLTTPTSTYAYNMDTRERELLKQKEVLNYQPDLYETKRIFATAEDGRKIPITLVYKKVIDLNGSSPLLQYAYGSYGSASDPYFRSSVISLLDRGFIYAIAHIRGGDDMGRYWYEEGKLLQKKNTFKDFIVCSEYLVNKNYTSKDKLFAYGGSAGGLLMGAIVNMRPDLYKGVIAAVPFVDVITTMLDESIPLTTGEYDEWGNPNNKKYYDYMLSYSPYDNVEKKDYPALLVTTGLHDSQVQYWEPAKWVAKLRDMKTDDNLLLLQTNMDAGHGGASGRFERFKETALDYTFLLMLLDDTKNHKTSEEKK